jgi:Flagellar hook-length control protein FliK
MDIGAALKAQMLGQLMDVLGKPGAAVTPVSLAAALQSGALKAGTPLQARVLSAGADGTLTIALGQQQLTARIDGAALPASARQSGALLTLSVASGAEPGAEPRLSFIAATPPANTPATPRVAETPPAPPSPAAQRQTAISAATVQAAARQGSAAPLFADLAALITRPGGVPLPASVLALASALLATRLDGTQPITGEALKTALQASGLLHEASSARSAAPVLDAKALLTLLKAALEPKGTSPETASSRAEGARPEPPRADGPVTAQKAALPSLATEPRAEVITATLTREVTEASDRLRLHQIASLPEAQPKSDTVPATRQLNLELPIALGQQTTIAGLRVERDRRRRSVSGEALDTWGVRFAIDADGIGPVHAHLRLQGASISVSLWAEDAGTHRLFVEALPHLEAALRESALEVQDLMVFSGRPAEAQRPAEGRLLDRSS